jgi:hypothetical protein
MYQNNDGGTPESRDGGKGGKYFYLRDDHDVMKVQRFI